MPHKFVNLGPGWQEATDILVTDVFVPCRMTWNSLAGSHYRAKMVWFWCYAKAACLRCKHMHFL